MRNIMITIQYDGSKYYGWQKQNDRPGIQNIIEDSIYKITKENTEGRIEKELLN